MSNKKFMTIREVAKTGLVSEYYLRNMEKQGCLPGIKSGNKKLVNYDLLIEFLDRQSAIEGGMNRE